MFEKYVTTVSLGGKEIQLNLYDTAGRCAGRPVSRHTSACLCVIHASDIKHLAGIQSVHWAWGPLVMSQSGLIPATMPGPADFGQERVDKRRSLGNFTSLASIKQTGTKALLKVRNVNQ